ncbi:Cytosolic Fe-S cluster assembly factor nar1 [Malassezia yamatoensis]|uniref:Cytosolic Fe-S cluster assembly factor NAR1 n=1 Tax=Malassezia yamatoensis TaxID=253288 RepID=A0AAJ5YTW5_9BASI|nr:Cytosolic Fe-S cluster assembly factor nar1 [Malassezia yamatoensis]
MAFSGALSVTDLNDYLGPSQVCIKPVEAPEVNEKAPGEVCAHLTKTEIAIDQGNYYESNGQRARTQLETAEISLNDCLACSGCVTSAETVLIGMQSIQEVQRELENPNQRTFVASISPQSLASLVTRYNYAKTTNSISIPMLFEHIALALRGMGFHFIQDTSFARHLALREHQREFFERRKARTENIPNAAQLPMLASACPGWVCYAEKAHSELLPYIAKTKSPQQISGVLAKRYFDSPERPNGVFHVAVMPCYDKKLEASREQFESDGVKEVDCVLTTGELHDLLLHAGYDFTQLTLPENPISRQISNGSQDESSSVQWPQLLQEPGTSSGGYLFAILHAVLDEYMQHSPSAKPSLELRVIRSVDYTDFVLRSEDGETLFKGAQCYGFRNLQNLVRKIQRATGARNSRSVGRGRMVRNAGKEDSAPYDYVEVMACPGGCVNGGGQMRPPSISSTEVTQEDTDQQVQGWQGTDKSWVRRVESAYWVDANRHASPTSQTDTGEQTKAIMQVLHDALDGELYTWLADVDKIAEKVEDQMSSRKLELFRTSYKGIAAQTNGLAVQW